MNSLTLHDRLMGGLIGVLVGDALGVPVEFSGREMRRQDPVLGMRGFGTWKQPAGTWSDDSSMTLVAADTLATSGWHLPRMMEGFREWLDENRWTAHGKVFDIGNATRNAIMLYRIHGDSESCGQTHEKDNGNGSLMRFLPTSCWLFGRPIDEQVVAAGQASALTHAHARARWCCAWHTRWCDALLSGRDVREATLAANAALRRYVPAAERSHVQRLLDASVLDLPREAVISGGYVVSTLEASVWCLARHGTYAAAVLEAVNLGGDTDTTAAVTGGMAGLRAGLSQIPPEWISALARRDEVLALANRFANACIEQWSTQPEKSG